MPTLILVRRVLMDHIETDIYAFCMNLENIQKQGLNNKVYDSNFFISVSGIHLIPSLVIVAILIEIPPE